MKHLTYERLKAMFGNWYKILVMVFAAAAAAACTPRDTVQLLRPPIPVIRVLPVVKSLPLVVPEIKSVQVLKPVPVVVTPPPIVVTPVPAPRERDERDERGERDRRHDHHKHHKRREGHEMREPVSREHIPPGHRPPRGKCRIWYPDRAPGHQPPPGNCERLKRHVPPGARLIYG